MSTRRSVLFVCVCFVSHRERGEGQADASETVQGQSQEDESWQDWRATQKVKVLQGSELL